MSAAGRAGVVLGVWLVALGSVFLVRQALDLAWVRAWPLFLIAAGVGTGAGALAGLVGRRMTVMGIVWAVVWPLVLIGIGLLLFVDFAGIVDIDAVGLLGRWWPLLLIAIGLLVLISALVPRGRGVEDRVSVPVDGVPSGEVVLKFGAGRLDVGVGTPGVLVEGTFEGGVIRRDRGPGRVELEADITAVFPGFGTGFTWNVGLAPDIPIDLRLEGGASRSTLDLGGLQVRTLIVKTGASETSITLPRGVDACDVRIEAGAAQVTIDVPDGVAAQVRSQMGLGSTDVDTARFPRTADGWESPDFATSARRAEIRIQGGVGTVRVR